MKKSILASLLTFAFCLSLSSQQYGSLKDSRDGKIYKTVKIGDQVWIAENLNVTTFRNGDSIPQARTNEDWLNAADSCKPAWCYYDNDPDCGIFFGKLYNWYAVADPRGLAPNGYKIPTESDIDIFISQISKPLLYFGPKSDDYIIVESIKLLSKKGWELAKEEKNNIVRSYLFNDRLNLNLETKYWGSVGFNALPGGERDLFRGDTINRNYIPNFRVRYFGSSWWGLTDYRSTKKDTKFCVYNGNLNEMDCVDEKKTAINYQILFGFSHLLIHFKDKGAGFYVRCIKD